MEKPQKIDFTKVGVIDAELTIAATLEDNMTLADAFAKNCDVLFGIKYDVKTAENLLIFKQAVEAHRAEKWNVVESKLTQFYKYISTNSPTLKGFDASKAAQHQKNVWMLADNAKLDNQTKMLRIRHEWRSYLMTLFKQNQGVIFANAAVYKADSVLAQKRIDHSQNPVLRALLKKYYSFLITRNIKQSWEAVHDDLKGDSDTLGLYAKKS